MAHTDRDDERWMRENHENKPCPYDNREVLPFVGGRLPVSAIHCEVCERLWYGSNRRRYYISLAAYSAYAKECRREERSHARRAMRECRDWDNLSIKYRRPYFD